MPRELVTRDGIAAAKIGREITRMLIIAAANAPSFYEWRFFATRTLYPQLLRVLLHKSGQGGEHACPPDHRRIWVSANGHGQTWTPHGNPLQFKIKPPVLAYSTSFLTDSS